MSTFHSHIRTDELHTEASENNANSDNTGRTGDLSAAFGLLATLLAAVGLYGVMAFTVARRTRELGMRMALGAQRANVVCLVMQEVFLLAGIGIGVALPLAFGLGRFIESQLFGLKAMDPSTLTAAALLLATVALAAGYIPALRATRIDPMDALRWE
jgi:ABC-type antimicrobial peptide transport system permease subunit